MNAAATDCAAPADPPPPLAAILDSGDEPADRLLRAVVTAAQAQGLALRGLLMTYPAGEDLDIRACATEMVLQDIANGDRYLVSQALGRASEACRADPQGFARASQVLRRAVAEADAGQPPALVISNRFGKLEAGGGGFAAELLELASRGIPVLTTVAPKQQADWQRFSGGAPVLEPDADTVAAWLREVVTGPTVGCAGLPPPAPAA